MATYIDTMRAMCAVLGVGRLTPGDIQPEAHAAATLAVQSGRAFRDTPYADGIDSLLQH